MITTLKVLCLRYVIGAFHRKLKVENLHCWDDEITPQLVELPTETYHIIATGDGFAEIPSAFYKLLSRGAIIGNAEMIMYCYNKGFRHFNHFVPLAIERNKLEIMSLLISLGANDWNEFAISAIKNAKLEIFEMMLEKGADDWDGFLDGAIEAGNLDMARRALDNHANFDEESAETIIRRGYVEFFMANFERMMLSRGQIDNFAAIAIWSKQMEMAKKIIDRYADVMDLDYVLGECAFMGNIELWNILITKGAKTWKNSFCKAIEGGQTLFLQILVAKTGVGNWNEWLQIAIEIDEYQWSEVLDEDGDGMVTDSTDIITYLVRKGADNWRLFLTGCSLYSREYVYSLPWKTEVAVDIWANYPDDNRAEIMRREGTDCDRCGKIHLHAGDLL